MSISAEPTLRLVERDDGVREVVLAGSWTLDRLAPVLGELQRALTAHGGSRDLRWNCAAIETIDSAGAMLLWRSWGRTLPANLHLRAGQRQSFERIAQADAQPQPKRVPESPFLPLMLFGNLLLVFLQHMFAFLRLLGQLLLDFLHILVHPRELPWHEISANLFKSGVRAMPVTALVGFLIGIVMSYLSALQLRQLGAEVFIVNILGMGLIRELGPVLVAVLVAGRSGSAMTAQIGVMRVTEEIDALAAMGVSLSLRVTFPKVAALSLAMPLLVVWATAIALLGGMVSAQIQLDISYGFFFETLPKVVPIANIWIGLFKGWMFGVLVALVACHFGLRIKPNTESLSTNTTSSVVTAITMVILLDAVVAIATRSFGMPPGM